MDPLTIMAISGVAQLYQSEKARGASAEQLKKLQQQYDAIKPPNYDLSIQDPPQLHTERLAAPEFAGSYKPEVSPFAAEQKSTTIQNSEDMQTGRAAQRAALQKLMQVGAGQFDPEYQAAVVKAQRGAQQEAQSRQQSILQDFARRGQGGSGVNLAAQLGGASQAMDRLGMQNLDAASQAYKNRLSALSQGAALGGQISDADQSLQAQNASIINGFNQRMAANQNAYNQNRTSTINEGNRFNIGRSDDIAKYNYNVAQANNDRDDANAKYIYGVKNSDRDFRNQMATQQYNDQLGKLSGQSSIASMRNAQTQQAAQDRNAMIGGMASAAGTYYSGQAADQAGIKNQMAMDDREFMKSNGRFMDEKERAARQGYYNG